jgi:ribosomal protein L24
MKKLHQGDEVIVIYGRDKGEKGTILKRIDDEFLLVSGIKMVKKHQKPNPSKGVNACCCVMPLQVLLLFQAIILCPFQ